LIRIQEYAMVRKLFCSMLVMVLGVSLVAAAEYQGRILKVEDGTVTFQKTKGKGKDAENDGDPIKLKVGKDAKVVAGKFDKDAMKVVDGDEIKDGLKNEMFSKTGKKGLNATVTTEGEGDKEAITKIRVFGGKKKKDAAE
jgi:hypothetical protein